MSDRGNTRIIAFMNQKGGVGKTTTTVNLAAAIALRGRRVLCVDLDPQAHLTLHLGIDPASLESSVYDLLIDPDLTAADVVQHASDNLDVLPAEVDLAAAEQELSDAPDRHARLRAKLHPLASQYDYVLLDCPPSLGLLTLNALAAAGEVIVPMQAHFLALQGLSKLLETVQLVRQSMNTALKVSGVVLAMHESQTNLAGEVVADLEQFFAASGKLAMPWSNAVIYRPPVRRNIKLAECPSFGQTIFEYAPHCAGAYDYAELATAVTGLPDQPKTSTPNGPVNDVQPPGSKPSSEAHANGVHSESPERPPEDSDASAAPEQRPADPGEHRSSLESYSTQPRGSTGFGG